MFMPISILHPPSLASPTLAYVPFVYPLPIWDYWPWLIVPLCLGVAIVYKSVKCQHMTMVPKEAIQIFVWILVGMMAAAGALAGVVKLVVEK
ncbi:MAG: hypothetical protein ABIP55_06790 [Tepidisphaeraceae bacterium]